MLLIGVWQLELEFLRVQVSLYRSEEYCMKLFDVVQTTKRPPLERHVENVYVMKVPLKIFDR